MDAPDPPHPPHDGPIEPAVETIACPGCAEAVEIDRTLGRTFTCPYCSSAFRLEGDDEDDDGEAERRELARRDEEELDGLRIRQFTAARRAAYRQRSYLIVALGGCAVATGQLLWMTYQHVGRAGWQAKPLGYLLFALASAVAAIMLARQVRLMSAALATSALAPQRDATLREPDFTPLSDGRDRWEKLNDVR
jgi:uncharacterized Zn-finger protein